MDAIETDGCTGFPDQLFGMDFTACCTVHDAGGTDGQLVDCLQGVAPDWGWSLVVFAVAWMVLVRPVYNLLQRWGWLAKTPGSHE